MLGYVWSLTCCQIHLPSSCLFDWANPRHHLKTDQTQRQQLVLLSEQLSPTWEGAAWCATSWPMSCAWLAGSSKTIRTTIPPVLHWKPGLSKAQGWWCYELFLQPERVTLDTAFANMLECSGIVDIIIYQSFTNQS